MVLVDTGAPCCPGCMHVWCSLPLRLGESCGAPGCLLTVCGRCNHRRVAGGPSVPSGGGWSHISPWMWFVLVFASWEPGDEPRAFSTICTIPLRRQMQYVWTTTGGCWVWCISDILTVADIQVIYQVIPHVLSQYNSLRVNRVPIGVSFADEIHLDCWWLLVCQAVLGGVRSTSAAVGAG